MSNSAELLQQNTEEYFIRPRDRDKVLLEILDFSRLQEKL